MTHARRRLVPLALIPLVVVVYTAAAEPLAEREVPDALRPWIAWVLHGHEDAACPVLSGQGEGRECAWPARLTLQVDDGGGRFSQEWRVYRDALVPLPGDDTRWPEGVTVDERRPSTA